MKLSLNIIVDCSHANSNKDHNLQPLVFSDCINQVIDGNKSIIGMMLESNIGPGNQKLMQDHSKMQYGVSITDACVDWATTEKTLLDAHKKLTPVLSVL
jgi:3-deoxy-7-phosphoheptulonate synthase